jgi:uncharacterized membrane protein AbrB (regulator of aidB expression)
MSNPIADPGHGHSPAAWAMVIIMLAGVAFGTLFFYLEMPALVWASVVVIVVGPIVGFAMKRAGYGVDGPKYQPKEH